MLFLLSTTFAFEFVIKSASEDLFFGDDSKKAYYPTLTSRPFANVFKIRTSECEPRFKIFYLDNNENTKLYYDEVTDKLGYHSGSTDGNEKFEVLVIDFDCQIYMISQCNQCLTYRPDRLAFSKRKCDPKNPQQLFKFVDIHPEMQCKTEIRTHTCLHPTDCSGKNPHEEQNPDDEHSPSYSHIKDCHTTDSHTTDSHSSFLEHELELKDAEINRLKLQTESCGYLPKFRDELAEKAQLASESMKKIFLERSKTGMAARRGRDDYYKAAVTSG